MKKFYILLFSLIITTCIYGQEKGDHNKMKLNQDNPIEKVQEIVGFKMYPNPVLNGKIFIITSLDSTKKIQILDIVGNQVMSTNLISRELDISKLTPGLYILKVLEEGKTATRKLVIK